MDKEKQITLLEAMQRHLSNIDYRFLGLSSLSKLRQEINEKLEILKDKSKNA